MKPWSERLARWQRFIDADIEIDEKGGVTSTALFSLDRQYRYFLSRIWDASKPPCVVCMTNPSTADAFKNDPTVARMVGFAHRWGCGGLIVQNVFALRSTDPQGVIEHPRPVGRYNLSVLKSTLREAPRGSEHVVAWGALAPRLCRATGLPAVDKTLAIYHSLGLRPRALGISKEGHPKHPLYLASTSELIEIPSAVK